METTMRRITQQRVEDLNRLARKGEAEGVRVLVDHRTGQHVATSASDPTRCYHVNVDGCSCKGFTFWGRCKHHSLLLAELGRMAPEPEPPTPAAPATCPDCGGDGWQYGEELRRGRLQLARLACWTCSVAGQVRSAA